MTVDELIPHNWKPKMRKLACGWWRITGAGHTTSARLPWIAYYRWLRHAWPRVAARHRAVAEASGANG